MKLQIKTLAQKTLLIDIDESKTVLDLKKELSLYPDIGVEPELQKLIYSGQILKNNDTLSHYNIDVKKFLVVMILKQPLPEEASQVETTTASSATLQNETEKQSSTGEAGATAPNALSDSGAEQTQTEVPAQKSKNEEMVERIVSMGYEEEAVRHALAASYYNAERAIEYLIEGTPVGANDEDVLDYDNDPDEASAFDIFRNDPIFRQLRGAIQQHPELIASAIQRIGEANPAILNLINENQQEFLNALMDTSDNESEEDEDTR